jgi:hypothetical protein
MKDGMKKGENWSRSAKRQTRQKQVSLDKRVGGEGDAQAILDL